MNTQILMQKLVFVASVASQAVLYVLLGLSVLSIGIIVERWWFFFRRRDNLEQLADGLRAALDEGDVAGARRLLAASPSVEAAIVGEAMSWYDRGPDAVEQILPKATRLRRKSFEAGLLFLGTLGNNAPFIGLFGTVLGVVDAFRGWGRTRRRGDGERDGGIAQALTATAVGILVALPAVIAYNVFQKKSQRHRGAAPRRWATWCCGLEPRRPRRRRQARPIRGRPAPPARSRVAEVEA